MPDDSSYSQVWSRGPQVPGLFDLDSKVRAPFLKALGIETHSGGSIYLESLRSLASIRRLLHNLEEINNK